LKERLQAYEVLEDRFGFLNEIGRTNALDSSQSYLSNLQERAQNLCKVYPNDLDELIVNEVTQFSFFMNNHGDEYQKYNGEISWELFQYHILIDKNLRDVFPNVEICLRIYLSLMVTNCTGERTFSKLKLIKNRIRTSLGEKKLVAFLRLSLNSDIARTLSFDSIITINFCPPKV
jgi:hypothetical protein